MPSAFPAIVVDAILADEVGIEAGVCGAFRLRSAIQPIFAPHAMRLFPVAVEAVVLAFREGMQVPIRSLIEQPAACGGPSIASLCRALQLRNHRHLDAEGLELFVSDGRGLDTHHDEPLAALRVLPGQLAELDIDPRLVVWRLDRAAGADWAVLDAIAGPRSVGVKFSVDLFGPGHECEESRFRILPDIVRIEAAWLRALSREAAPRRLLASHVDGLHDRGARVLVFGIEERDQLAGAVELGADLLQGAYLAAPRLVGEIFPEEPLPLSELMPTRGKVVTLFS